MPVRIPVATRRYSDYTLSPNLTETAVQGAIPTESYGNFGLDDQRRTSTMSICLAAYAASEVGRSPQMTRNSRPPRHAGSGRSGFQGLISAIPVPEKSSVLRVASVASAVRQMAAIWASATPMGRPSVSLPQAISAYREAQRSSKGRTRARKSVPSRSSAIS